MRRRGFRRELRINDVIRTAIAGMIQRGEAGDLHFVTVTSVSVSPDLSFAKVYVSVLEEKNAKSIVSTLNEEAKHLRHLLGGEVRLRIIPVLKFYHDDSIVRGSRISSLIDDVLKDKD